MKTLSFLMSKLSVYLAISGILSGILLVKILAQEDPLPLPLTMPAINPFEDAIAASGIIESLDRNIAIGAPVSGLIVAVLVQAGDHVRKGEILFKIDDRDLQAQLLVQKANVEVAKANVKRIADQLKRLKSVEDPRAVSVDEVTTRHNDVVIALAQYRAAKSQVKQLEILIDRLAVKAPREGIILQSNVREGEFLSINTSTPPILLGDMSRLQIRTDIDEQNASHFNPYQSAFAYPKNNTKLRIPLKFERIEPYVIPKRSLTGSSDERVDTRVLQVLYSFEEPKDFHVYVGQQVDVFIQTKTEPN